MIEDIEDQDRDVEEYSAEELLPQEVEDLLCVLQSGTNYVARKTAAEQLGKVGTSSRRIVRALIAARESHSYPVSRAAAKSLRAPVHQEYLKQHPGLMGGTEEQNRDLEEEAAQRREFIRRNRIKAAWLVTLLLVSLLVIALLLIAFWMMLMNSGWLPY